MNYLGLALQNLSRASINLEVMRQACGQSAVHVRADTEVSSMGLNLVLWRHNTGRPQF
jgi:hypothetical protein